MSGPSLKSASSVQRPESRVQSPAFRVQSPASSVQRPNLVSRVQEFRYAYYISVLETDCVPFVLKTRSCANVRCVLTCSRANVPYMLTWPRDLCAHVLVCWRALGAYVLTSQHALRTHVLTFQHALSPLPHYLTWLRDHLPTWLVFSASNFDAIFFSFAAILVEGEHIIDKVFWEFH